MYIPKNNNVECSEELKMQTHKVKDMSMIVYLWNGLEIFKCTG